MADNIKIEVGIKNSVKKEMAQVERDIETAVQRTARKASAMKALLSGNFAEGAAGIFESLEASSKASLRKFGILGTQIASAIAVGFAGFKLGQYISEKLDLWGAGEAKKLEEENKKAEARISQMEQKLESNRRAKSTASENAAQAQSDFAYDQASPMERVRILTSRLSQAAFEKDDATATDTKRLEAKAKYYRLLKQLMDANEADEKARIDRQKKLEDEFNAELESNRAAHAEAVKRDYEEQQDAEKRLRDSKRNTAEVEAEFTRMALEDERKAVQEKMDLDAEARDKRMEELRKIANETAGAADKLEATRTGWGFNAMQDAARTQARDDKRREFQIQQAMDAEGRGSATPRQKAMLEAYWEKVANIRAQQEMDRLQKEAAEAQKDASKSLKSIDEKIKKALSIK